MNQKNRNACYCLILSIIDIFLALLINLFISDVDIKLVLMFIFILSSFLWVICAILAKLLL